MALSCYSNLGTSQHEFTHYLAQEDPNLPPDPHIHHEFVLQPDSWFNIDSPFGPNNFDFPLPSENNLDPPPPPDYNTIISNFQQSYIPQEIQPPLIYSTNNYEQIFSEPLRVGPKFNGPQDSNFGTGFGIPDWPDFWAAPPAFGCSSNETAINGPRMGCGSPLAQSIAARQRRRKISEKTSELGRLVPGAHRMNTAEMFAAAYKYINFLRAQVGILEIYRQEKEGAFQSDEELLGLVGLPLIQEKLYSAERCIVPRRLMLEEVDELEEVPELKARDS